jgi:membrane associated rhomboid family serine protease
MTLSLTLLVTIFTVGISILAINDPTNAYKSKLSHYPYIESRQKEYYRWLTSGFIHNDYGHLAINMFMFYQCGVVVEQVYTAFFGDLTGRLLFLGLYLGAIIVGCLPSYFKNKDNQGYAALGASGGVAGIMFAYALFAPTVKIALFFVIPMYMIVWALLYLMYEHWASRRMQDNIGHDAHLYGAIFGFIATAVMIPRAFPHFISEIMNLVNGVN